MEYTETVLSSFIAHPTNIVLEISVQLIWSLVNVHLAKFLIPKLPIPTYPSSKFNKPESCVMQISSIYKPLTTLIALYKLQMEQKTNQIREKIKEGLCSFKSIFYEY